MRSLRRLFDAARRAGAAFARHNGGSPVVEFALVAPIFIVVVYATVQVALIYTAQSYLETAAEETARQVLTNQTTSMTQSQFKSQLCSNIGVAFFTCGNVMVGLRPATSTTSISTAAPSFNPDGTLVNPLTYLQPATGQYGVLQVLYLWPVIGLPLGWNFSSPGMSGKYLMMSTQVFMVEPKGS